MLTFWQTWWFIGSVALLLVGGTILVCWLRLGSIEARSRELQLQIYDRTNELSALNDITAVTSRSLHLQEVLSAALEKTLQVTGLEAGGIYLLHEADQLLIIEAARGLSDQVVREIDGLKVGEGLTGRVVQSGEALVVEDVSADPRLTRLAVQEGGFHSLVVVPLAAKGHVLGSMFIISRGYREFAPHDLDYLTSIGRQVGVAVENARLFEAEQRRAEQFRLVAEVSRRFTLTLDIEELLRQVAELIQQTFRYYHVGIGLVEGDEVVYRVGAGALLEDTQFQFRPARLKIGQESLSGWVAGSGEALLVPDVSQDPRYVLLHGSQACSELVVPINVKGQTIGVLDVQSDHLNAFDQNDLTMLQSLANQAGVAIENARLYAQARQLAVMEERNRLARDLHDSVSQSLYGMTLYSMAAASQLTAGNLALVAEHLQVLQDTSQDALTEMRLLIFELRPPVLEEEGLVAALQARLSSVELRAGLKTELNAEIADRLQFDKEIELYRIAQEALNNILKHAHARHVVVGIRQLGQTVSMEIIDDGAGFNPEKARAGGRLGLSAMEERAAGLGGRFGVDSQPGVGTRVWVEVSL
jgi:signal transduction histidine kinase